MATGAVAVPDGDGAGTQHLVECPVCAERFRVGTHRLACPPECPGCGAGGPSPRQLGEGATRVSPEGDRDEMCARHWLLEGVRDGSCPACLGAELPDGRGAVIVVDGGGVTFAGETGDLPLMAAGILGPLAEAAAGHEPGTVLATFPSGDLDAIELSDEDERGGQMRLSEVAP